MLSCKGGQCRIVLQLHTSCNELFVCAIVFFFFLVHGKENRKMLRKVGCWSDPLLVTVENFLARAVKINLAKPSCSATECEFRFGVISTDRNGKYRPDFLVSTPAVVMLKSKYFFATDVSRATVERVDRKLKTICREPLAERSVTYSTLCGKRLEYRVHHSNNGNPATTQFVAAVEKTRKETVDLVFPSSLCDIRCSTSEELVFEVPRGWGYQPTGSRFRLRKSYRVSPFVKVDVSVIRATTFRRHCGCRQFRQNFDFSIPSTAVVENNVEVEVDVNHLSRNHQRTGILTNAASDILSILHFLNSS